MYADMTNISSVVWPEDRFDLITMQIRNLGDDNLLILNREVFFEDSNGKVFKQLGDKGVFFILETSERAPIGERDVRQNNVIYNLSRSATTISLDIGEEKTYALIPPVGTTAIVFKDYGHENVLFRIKI